MRLGEAFAAGLALGLGLATLGYSLYNHWWPSVVLGCAAVFVSLGILAENQR